jgi:hypothetical protein
MTEYKETDFRPDQPPITKNYVPTVYFSIWSYISKTPPFTLLNVSNMLADFRIRWGLWMLKGPIMSKGKFFIKTEDAEVKEYLIKTVTRFWRTSAIRALKAIEWGYSCNEALYRTGEQDGLIHFHSLKDIHSYDARALTRDGHISAANIYRVPKKEAISAASNQKVTLYGPRKLWHTHARELHPFYGQSRLYGAYLPWIEIWTDGGYRDSRRLFFHKYAFDGGGLYVPEGTTNVGDDGTGRPRNVANMVLGRDIIDKKKTGGTTILPGITDDQGKRKWEPIPPTINPTPAGLMEYGEILKDEMWEGMGIPPEIARAQGTGSYAGRVVPLMGFYSILQELIYWLIHDADEQIFRPLVDFNFGEGREYEIIPFSILDEALKEENEEGGGEEGGELNEGKTQPSVQEPPRTKKPVPPQGTKLSLEQADRAQRFLVKTALNGMKTSRNGEKPSPNPMVL